MNPKEIKALIKMLKASGVTHFKSNDIELNLTPSVSRETPRRKTKAKEEESQEIKHKVEELTSLLKLSDKELVDRLFPDTLQEEAEESANNEIN